MSTGSMADQLARLQFVVRHSCELACRDLSAIASLVGLPWLQKILRDRCSSRKGVALVVLSLLTAVGALGAAAWLSVSIPSQEHVTCPAHTPMRKATIVNGPVDLWAQALSGKSPDGWTPGSTSVLQRCVSWRAAAGALPPLEQMRAQLQCQAALSEASPESADVPAFLQRAKQVLAAVEGISQRCSSVHTKVRGLYAAGAAVRQPLDVVVTLGGLANFEASVREASQSLGLMMQLLQAQGGMPGKELLARASLLQTQFKGCVFQTMREARKITHSLPLANAAIRQVQLCRPDMLGGLERLALHDMEADVGSMFSKGLLLSESATAPADAPFFGVPSPITWKADMKGRQAPADLVFSEQMLLRGIDKVAAAEVEESAKAMVMQLAAHAKLLTQLKQYAAAEWRYRVAVEVARKYGLSQMESSGLAQLSYFLSLHGAQEHALAAASDALRLSEDALASYLQATLQLSLGGELRTTQQVQTAMEQLKALSGRLPTQELELSRAAAVSKLEAWKVASEDSSLSSCLVFADAAQILICATGKIAQAFAV
eukprot:TRINITY_DN101240_c0_g1_i1.p1 TRINITY_DN101240_c0_g1~~TRINITY_DN101240_c0_g1_i1.p1  ORF type:complete len:545 (+),score=144.08 TRINITY_DN101240_c0_g1_i1:125-1759(+)